MQPNKICSIAGLLSLALAARAADSAAPLPDVEAELAAPALIDYAMVYGLNVPQPTRRDAEYILVWLNAATTAAPDYAEAWQWAYDLRSRLGDDAGALAALEAYSRVAPEDVLARLDLLSARFNAAQSVEDRMKLCSALADDSSAPAEVRSEAHRRLAELLRDRGERDEAMRQARAALDALPGNIPARQFIADLQGKLDDPATQIELLLAEVQANPAGAAAAWQLARLTSRLGLSDESKFWLDRAAASLAHSSPDGQLPPAFLLEKASAAFEAGRDDEVVEACKELLGRNPNDAAAAMLFIQSARRAGGLQLADDQTKALDARFREAEAKVVSTRDAATCLQIARFHLDISPDAHRALDFARKANEFRPGDALVRATLGEALVATDTNAEAIKILAPLAEHDALAAAALARAQLKLNDRDAATKTIQAASRIPADWQARARIADVLHDMNLPAPPPPDRAELRAKLASLDRRVLDFPQKPADFLSLEVSVTPPSIALAAPVYARVRLTNRGPFPITLGDDRMVPPAISVSVADDAPNEPGLVNYLTIPLDTHLILAPGATMEVERRVSAGAGRAYLEHQPQRRRALEFRFVLAPEQAGNEVRSRLADFPVAKCTAIRLAVDAAEPSLQRLRQLVRQGSPGERFHAVETILALILERYEALQTKKPHNYAAATIAVEPLIGDLLAALRDPLPTVRARALAALVYIKPNEAIVNAAAPLITDAHWLPRLVAIELFAKHQGRTFEPVLVKQTGDEAPPVAALAELYLQLVRTQSPPQYPGSP